MKFKKSSGEYQRLDPNMTPMIDVCFQLILFFIANMRLFSPEGDFAIEMPAGSPRASIGKDADTPIITVRLKADRNGKLAKNGIEIGLGGDRGQRPLTSLRELRSHVRAILRLDEGGPATPTNIEVAFDCDYNLKYEYVMAALTAVSGYPGSDSKIVHMIEKVRFLPPRAPP